MFKSVICEPRHETICYLCFRPGPIQTGSLDTEDDRRLKNLRECTIYMTICAFIFLHMEKIRFSQDAAHVIGCESSKHVS